MRVKQWIDHYRYLGYDKETFLRCKPSMDRRNYRVLRQSSSILGAVSFLLALVFLFFIPDRLRLVIWLVTFFIMGYTFRQSRLWLKSPARGRPSADLLILCMSLIMYCIGIVMGTVASNGDLAVLVICLFLCVQYSFDTSPLLNAATLFPCAVVFSVLSHAYKSAYAWRYDMLHMLIAIVVGLFMSYKKTRFTIGNIVTSQKLRQVNDALYHSSTTDELTGLNNRRKIFDRMEEIKRACEAHDAYLGCVVLDIDDFKAYNDTYGHPAGDNLLRLIGDTFLRYGEQNGIDIGRIGGEEFLAVWEEKTPARCERIAEELREIIEELQVPHKSSSVKKTVTISTGVCCVRADSADRTYFYADKALYSAKSAGKNRSFLFTMENGDIAASKSSF